MNGIAWFVAGGIVGAIITAWLCARWVAKQLPSWAEFDKVMAEAQRALERAQEFDRHFEESIKDIRLGGRPPVARKFKP